MEHSFDIEVAKEYGIVEAIFIKHFQFWISKNKANGVHQYEDRTWTYNSNKAFAELFPYLSTQSIRTALKHLTDKSVVMTGNYNPNPYNKTLWYAFVNEEKWICQFQQTDLLKSTNGFVRNGKCINTDIDYTDNKPDNKPNNITPSITQGEVIEWSEEEELFETFRLAYQGSKNGHDTEFKNFKKHKDWKEVVRFLLPAYERQEAIREQQKRETGWRPQPKNLKTWLNNRCWEEEIKYDSNQTTTNNHANEIERARQSALEHLRSKGINI